MEQRETVVTTARIGQRGRLILPAQIQRATGVMQGTLVALRTGPDGTITIEPLWAVRARLKATYAPLLAGHLPANSARLHAGGRGLDPTDLTDLGPVLQPLPDRDPGSGRRVYRDDQCLVLTARAVLAWFTSSPGDLVEDALPYGVLPEAAVTDLITTLAKASAHEHADALIADLAVLGVRLPGPTKRRATLAEDTALALELIQTAAQAGHVLTMADAVCAATSRRLEAGLVAADLLTPAP